MPRIHDPLRLALRWQHAGLTREQAVKLAGAHWIALELGFPENDAGLDIVIRAWQEFGRSESQARDIAIALREFLAPCRAA